MIFFGVNLLFVFQLCTSKITASALISAIFLGSFKNMARTFVVLRSRMNFIMEVLPQMHMMDHLTCLMRQSISAFMGSASSFFQLMLSNLVQMYGFTCYSTQVLGFIITAINFCWQIFYFDWNLWKISFAEFSIHDGQGHEGARHCPFFFFF